jgi:hypothetical protein
MKIMKPVLIFVYNRPYHTRETLKALSLNEGADKTCVIIYSDGAKSDSDILFVNEVREICRQADGFYQLTIVEREKNYGLAGNIISAVSLEIEKAGSVIVLEDDLITSPGFLNFMNNALEYYRNTNIFSICGYSPQLNIPADYPYSTYLSPRIGSWGWASWQEKWNQVDWETVDFYQFIRNSGERNRFEKGGNDLTIMLLKQKLNKINSWAVRFTYACYKVENRVVYPVQSLIRNAGIDGSGTHMKKTKKYQSNCAESIESNLFCPAEHENDTIQTQFARFYSTSIPRRGINFFKLYRFLIWERFQKPKK